MLTWSTPCLSVPRSPLASFPWMKKTKAPERLSGFPKPQRGEASSGARRRCSSWSVLERPLACLPPSCMVSGSVSSMPSGTGDGPHSLPLSGTNLIVKRHLPHVTLRLAQCFGLATAMRFRLGEGHVGIDKAKRQIADQNGCY